MKKLFQKISFWWNYVVLKKEHEEEIIVYGKDYNKKNALYYYEDKFKVFYIGTKEINRIRLSRTFISQREYLAHQYPNK